MKRTLFLGISALFVLVAQGQSQSEHLENDKPFALIVGVENTPPVFSQTSTHIVDLKLPVHSYRNNFDERTTDFVTQDFVVSNQVGFESGILQTVHPYPVSKVEGESYNLIAQLRSPIILKENGVMTFDEVVLVEPGICKENSSCRFYWDYVVVEGSKDHGISWYSFLPQYDSKIQQEWESVFNYSMVNGSSKAVPEETMLTQKTIELTENDFFSAGDTVLVRFRLASDITVNGWGWAIDNLSIQAENTLSENMTAVEELSVYPNPFTNSLNIRGWVETEETEFQATIRDLTGRLVLNENFGSGFSEIRASVDCSALKPGVYVISLHEGNSIISTRKIVKN